MKEAASGSADLNNTDNASFAQESAGTPNLVAFTSATVTVASGDIAGTNTPFNLTIARGGADLTSTQVSATGANVTLSTSSTLTTPDNGASWTLSGDVDGGTLSNVSYTLSREQRVV